MHDARTLRRAAAALAFALLAACGKPVPTDPNNREIPWNYGPRTNDSTAAHLGGTGTKGGAAIAKGWQCRLVDGKQLVVRPYQLSSSHPLFDKVVLSVGLFDKNGKPIVQHMSELLTAKTEALTFDVTPEQASKLYDLILYYVAK
jgi:hypothetical protein